MASTVDKVIDVMKHGMRIHENGCDNILPTEEILPVQLTHLTPALLEEARRDLKETDEVRQKALYEIRKLIEDEKNLVTLTDDLFLLAFLRARKFNVKKAFKLLQNYWSFRKEYHKIFDNSDHLALKHLLLRNFIGLLPHRDRKGCVVLVCKVGLWNPELDSYEAMFRTISGLLVYCIDFHATQIAGFRAIFDLRGLSWVQMKYCTPANLYLLVRSTQFAFPGRYKGVHILCESKFFHVAWNMVQPVLSAKLRKRIFIHGNNVTSLLEYIHPSVLPDEYGGQAGPFENGKWEAMMDKNISTVSRMLKYGYKDKK